MLYAIVQTTGLLAGMVIELVDTDPGWQPEEPDRVAIADPPDYVDVTWAYVDEEWWMSVPDPAVPGNYRAPNLAERIRDTKDIRDADLRAALDAACQASAIPPADRRIWSAVQMALDAITTLVSADARANPPATAVGRHWVACRTWYLERLAELDALSSIDAIRAYVPVAAPVYDPTTGQ